VDGDAPDAEVLQLLALLDGGVRVVRQPYQEWRCRTFVPLDPGKLHRAAVTASRRGLAFPATAHGGGYVLHAAPIHLDAGNGATRCGDPLDVRPCRLRYTADPTKVTHEKCRPIKAGDVVRFKGGDMVNTYDVTELDGDGNHYARVWWNNPPEDYTDEIVGRWVPLSRLERVTN
jgi:hypothetical protein